MNKVLEDFSDFYRHLDRQSLSRLPDIYHPDIEFCDPVHSVHGIGPFTRYFEQLMRQVPACRFDIQHIDEMEDTAYLHWIMEFRHPRLNGGAEIRVPGISYVKFSDRVTYHRDYYDLGCMMYENIPLLGSAIRALKKRLA